MHRIAAVGAIISCLFALWQLETLRSGLIIEPLVVGTTPATIYRPETAEPRPAVIIAHGFAGSRQLMESYALNLARAGYVAVSFDFAGHGRNPTPMTGDVTRVEGTTQILMQEIGRLTDAVSQQPFVDGRIALLGHSMASDIIVRQSIADPRISATVAISIFSEAVTVDQPRNLLMITGAWETFLRGEALRALRLSSASADEGDVVGDPSAGTGRRAVVAPWVEHVGVLYSKTGIRAARDWLDQVFGRSSSGPVHTTGGWIVLLLTSIVVLAWPLSQLLPAGEARPQPVPRNAFLAAALIPAIATPLLLSLFATRFLPVLVADYLAIHFFTYGVMALAALRLFGVGVGRIAVFSGLALAVYGIVVFGGAIDRYAASFMPHAGRLPILVAIAIGTVTYMLADSVLSEAGHAPWWRIWLARAAFLGSLAAAVALDFERLFFLLIILPVVLAFFLIFGLMGGWVGRRTDSPVAPALGLGLILAWSLGVTFPLFA